MDVVERVARALAKCAGYDPDETWEEFDRNAAATASMCDGVSDDEIFPKFIRWREYEAPARAAIAAVLDSMAEPSHDVTAAVVKPMQDRTWAVETWQAMLAAMRAEMLGPTPPADPE